MMQVVYRNKKLLEKAEKEKHRISLIRIAKKIKRLYPMLYEEVGSKNVRKILRAVFRNGSRDKMEE
jgi:hypothetical protein